MRKYYKLTTPAQVGGTIFDVGVSELMVIERAQREYAFQRARMKRVKAFIKDLRRPSTTTSSKERQ